MHQTNAQNLVSKSSFGNERSESILWSHKWDICDGSCPPSEQCLLSNDKMDSGLTIIR